MCSGDQMHIPSSVVIFFFDILLGKDGAYIISIRHSDDGRLFKVFFSARRKNDVEGGSRELSCA